MSRGVSFSDVDDVCGDRGHSETRLVEDIQTSPIDFEMVVNGINCDLEDGRVGNSHSFPAKFFNHLESNQNITIRGERRRF